MIIVLRGALVRRMVLYGKFCFGFFRDKTLHSLALLILTSYFFAAILDIAPTHFTHTKQHNLPHSLNPGI
jgi:hypothetical protein